MYRNLEFTIKGVAPLIMHNGQLSDPLNEWAKGIAPLAAKSNKDKTDADREEISRLEWFGGLYAVEGRVVIPGVNLEGCLRDGGSKERLGPKFSSAVICDGDFPLEYDGPKDVQKMWESGKFRDTRRVSLKGKSSLQRTRPIFRNWSLKFVASYLDEILNQEQVVKAARVAGQLVGLCDYTPRFGRFEVVDVKAI